MFKKLGDTLSAKFQRRDEFSKQLEIVKVFDLYKQQLKKILPHTQRIKPESLKNGVLTVRVSSAVAANELRLQESGIIIAINGVIGREAVRRIVYRF